MQLPNTNQESARLWSFITIFLVRRKQIALLMLVEMDEILELYVSNENDIPKCHILFRLWLSLLTVEDHERLLHVRSWGFEILSLSGRSKKLNEEKHSPYSIFLTTLENCYETMFPGCAEQVGCPATSKQRFILHRHVVNTYLTFSSWLVCTVFSTA